MPGMSGLEVQEWLAQAGNDLPIIFITAHDEVGVRERALALGAVAFLRKPFDDELFDQNAARGVSIRARKRHRSLRCRSMMGLRSNFAVDIYFGVAG